MKGKNIYLLEDDPDIQEIIRYLLVRDGHKVFAFEKVKDFNRQLEAGLPDLFILDINLPDGNGLEIVKNLTASIAPVAPVLLMSADIMNERRALESGANTFISKPFRVEELLSTVDHLLAA